MDKEIELNGNVIREWLKKHGVISFFLGIGLSFLLADFLQQILNNETIGTIAFWIILIIFAVWIQNGILGLKNILGFSVVAVKWLLGISIAIFLICLIVGWFAALAPTTIIIILLFLILIR
ncbi:MAG: hypothetical protein PHP97_01840 [Candidatus Shapirobacteria bacterium]|nr:hypothetical protein [Candidatus Shapirobacteria bacterium]MDD3003200.1 hypothetical protein [Candidatus Shapirobacteria bacterium]MDD4383164.1 hypothetical protein [Candidatus Shapirobacteria bacterium]